MVDTKIRTWFPNFANAEFDFWLLASGNDARVVFPEERSWFSQ
jgi:hypothetical protein